MLTSHNFFLQQILKMDEHIIPHIISVMKDKYYNASQKRWPNFPPERKGEEENTFYEAFVALANNTVSEIINQGVATDQILGKWVDCHSQTPGANAKVVAEIRPDCAFVSNEDAVMAASHAHDDHCLRRRPLEETLNETEVNENARIWWRQMILPVEVKIQDKKHHLGAFPQLCNYIRQIFRQQLDRSFAFGITLSFNKIAMWLCDRSGALGMTPFYDIHENPDEFIRIIAAASLLPNYGLGWDPTMKLYDVVRKEFNHSYNILPSQSDKKLNLSVDRWLLTFFDVLKTDDRKEIILTGHPLLVRTADGMNGRAVQVHRGYLYKDEEKEYREPLVVKSSWQPVSKLQDKPFTEAYLYSLIPELRNRVYGATVVRANQGDGSDLQNSSPVSTFKYIRQNAKPDTEAARELNRRIKKLEAGGMADLDETEEILAFMEFSSLPRLSNHIHSAEDIANLTDRVQTRVALNVWGWPLKYFTDLKELLTVIRDAVIDHRNMYKAGILHRDISAANILIRPASPHPDKRVQALVAQTSGILIDLDHAIYTTHRTGPGVVTAHDDIQACTEFLQRARFNVKRDVAAQALKFMSMSVAVAYFEESRARNVLNADISGDWTAEDLGWNDVGERPNYEFEESTVNERTGTIPFISHDLMANVSTPHEAIHDMESLFWVVVYLCLTRESGGGQKRKNPSEHLERLVKELFESDDASIFRAKSMCFLMERREVAFNNLLKHFHPYFEPLKPMLQRWWNSLILGYSFKAYEYYLIHDFVIKIIEGALNDMPDENSEVKEQELRRRELDYRFISNIPGDPTLFTSDSVPPFPYLVGPGGVSPKGAREEDPSQSSTSVLTPLEPPRKKPRLE